MKPAIYAILICFIGLLLVDCDNSSRSSGDFIASKEAAPAPSEDQDLSDTRNMQPGPEQAPIERKLIKTGSISFETDDLAKTHNRVLEAVKTHQGYLANDEEQRSDDRISHVLTIRVPADHFDTMLSTIAEGVDHFDYKNIQVQDVTEEYLDVEARLKAKKALEQRYLELLKQARNVTEILNIEKELGTIRADIESVEGRLKYLSNQVAFGTLSVTYYERIEGQTAFGRAFKNGFRNGWNNLIWFFVGIINLWPFVLLLVAVIFVWKKWRNRRKSS